VTQARKNGIDDPEQAARWQSPLGRAPSHGPEGGVTKTARPSNRGSPTRKLLPRPRKRNPVRTTVSRTIPFRKSSFCRPTWPFWLRRQLGSSIAASVPPPAFASRRQVTATRRKQPTAESWLG
jgi:hypothetical protein